MNRRLFFGSLSAALLCGSAAFARDYSDEVLRQLRRNGYDVVSVSRTLLGRTRIRAAKGGGEREIILNAATGEILRDVWIAARTDGKSGSSDDDEKEDDGKDDKGRDDDDDDDNGGGDDNSGSGGGNSGSGGSDDDDEDDDDDDDGDE